MGIRFIFGRAGSGKSEFCLKSIDKKIRECDKDNKLILLVPDQYTFQSEKKLLEHTGEKSLLRAEVLSFKRMANRVFDRVGGRTENIIEDSGKNMLIYKLLKENMDDLFQVGCIGLIKALDNFDMSHDVKFSTYAVPMIIGEIRRFLRDDGMIKVSRPLKELAGKVGAAREKLEADLGREPTVEELARSVGASREEVAASMEAGARVGSIYEPFDAGDESGGCLADKIAEKTSENDRVLDRIVLAELLSGLGEKEQQIIKMRYFENMTQTVIAGRLGISQVQVSRLEKKILREMRERLTS